ncbi:SpoIIE family protein phosphatase [Kitasatospora sp. SolWspMP-SS2h]|uniref:SpoIIE family protein phosphatase n=1 Tax=Kitasatospora sp. SolWspMP-SS2h TaxID=1305729 RepID=UPI000DBA24CA|nr:SpoIIE family protein phosphatase [Kitasatospora sp. SolWspMP-SS2h]
MFGADPAVGADLARVDWSATPLGDPADWPQSLRSAVDTMLSSRFSMWMGWGPDLTFFCNGAYRRDTLADKYPWALGRPFREVWAEVWEDARPRIEHVLTEGEATWDEALPLRLRRSGYPEESYHTFSYSPLRDEADAVVGVLCVVSEDTQRVVAERRMATLRDLGSDPGAVRTEGEFLAFSAEQLARNPYDLPFTLTYLFDDRGGAELAASSGVPAGHPAAPARTGPGEPGPWPAAAVRRGGAVSVPLTGGPFAELPRGAWEEPPREARLVPLSGPGGEPSGFLVVGLNRYRPADDAYLDFVDLVAGRLAVGITSARNHEAQQRRAEQLAELDRAKTAFFSNISHEFRTPLTLISGPVEGLRQRLADADPDVQEDLETVHRNTLRLSRLVNTLLDFSRIEAGRMRARPEPVDLARVTAELAAVFRSAAQRAGLVLEVDCAPLSAPVPVDPELWEKVVFNLLSNALKFTFEGTVRVRVRERDGRALVTVEDTGVGVPAAELPRLFDRFHRVENSRARSHEGSGIGLALVKELVELHGGTITVDSVPDRGTSFTVSLPLADSGAPAAQDGPDDPDGTARPGAEAFVQEALRWEHRPSPGPAGPQPDTGAPTDGPPAPDGPTQDGLTQDGPTQDGAGTDAGAPAHVLVVDDNADMRDYLSRILRGAGHRVTAVADGDRALAAVRTAAPELVISDVMMPGTDGLRLVAALRADRRTAALPVLLLSARAGREDAIDGFESGADDYLVKPFAATDLLARVRAALRLARLRDQHTRWQDALVDSLQDAFFVCDEDGAVLQVNQAFTDILGYGPEGLPYPAPHPWWADPATDPDAHRQAADALARATADGRGSSTAPVTHRDGHRIWTHSTFSRVPDPATGRTVTVGTFRDVTAEYYAIQRESALALLADCLSRATGAEESLACALAEMRGLWRARRVVAVHFDRAGAAPRLTAAGPCPDWPDLPEEHRAALTALAAAPALTPVQGPAGTGIRLERPGGPLVLVVELGERRPFTREDELLLVLLGGRLAQGLARAQRIDQQRETAIALQRAILGPDRLPPGFAARYEPATPPLEVGGDWYDTVPLPDGRIGIIVGDCVGRGLAAASVMGQLRSACRALLLQDHSPARTLAALDAFAAAIPGAVCTTVFCGVLDPATGELRHSSAGHPPAVLARADGSTALLEGGRALPLAVRPGLPRPEATTVLPGRSTLLLYTDGLVERRRDGLAEGIAQAGRAVVTGAALPTADLPEHVTDLLRPAEGFEDDVAVLLYRQPAVLTLSFPARPQELPAARAALRAWLAECGVPAGAAREVSAAGAAALAESFADGADGPDGAGGRHGPDAPDGLDGLDGDGPRSPDGTVRLTARATADRLRVTVARAGGPEALVVQAALSAG